MSAPSIAVVVATHNRAPLLPRLVAALAAQDIEAPFEVVIVDDASTDDTEAVLAELAARHPWLRATRLDRNTGPAVARNRGWRATQASCIAFTDDDCIPEPSWLRILAVALGDADVVQGRTEGDATQMRDHGPFGHTMTVRRGGSYETCNIAYRRSVLERVNGFDEAFALPYGEDTDLGLRVEALGGKSAFRDDAVVHHDVEPSDFLRYLRRRARRADFVLAISRHPQLRRELRVGLFTHPNALAAALAVGWTVRRPSRAAAFLAAVLVARHARATMRALPPPRQPAAWALVVPAKLAADIYEISVTVRASARYRTLVI